MKTKTVIIAGVSALLVASCTSEDSPRGKSNPAATPAENRASSVSVSSGPTKVAPGKGKAAEHVTVVTSSLASFQEALNQDKPLEEAIVHLKPLEKSADEIYKSLSDEAQSRHDMTIQDFREAIQELQRTAKAGDTTAFNATLRHTMNAVMPNLNRMLEENDQVTTQPQ